jgi:hypothetical protein
LPWSKDRKACAAYGDEKDPGGTHAEAGAQEDAVDGVVFEDVTRMCETVGVAATLAATTGYGTIDC